MKKTLLIALLAFLLGFSPAGAAAQPDLSAEAAVLMDMKSGQILFQKNKDKKMYPASTTKILTTLIAIKGGRPGDVVKVSREACQADGSSVGLQEDEVVRLEDLIYMVMLSSANDAAMAVAQHIGGSVEEFSRIMNSEARAMGAVNSNFTNPHGLHDPDHYTTAGDLAIITREAMKNDIFRKYAGTYSHQIKRNLPGPVNGIPQEDFVNLNRMLWPGSIYEYRGITGVKTGYTDEARRCLVASADRNGRELLTVVLKTEFSGVYADTASLLNYGFDSFKQVVLVEAGAAVGRAGVQRGVEKEVGAVTSGEFTYNIPVNATIPVEKKILTDDRIVAPVKKGQKVGTMQFVMGGGVIGGIDLVAGADVDREPFFRWWYGAVLLAFFLLYARSQARARRRRYTLRKKRWY